jgi:hypothetical protein
MPGKGVLLFKENHRGLAIGHPIQIKAESGKTKAES